MEVFFNLHAFQKDSAVYKACIRLINLLSSGGDSIILMEKYTRDIRKADYVVCSSIWQVLFTWFYLLGSRTRIVFWIQGVVAEESFLKKKSKSRYLILKLVEKISLIFSDAYIYVSPYMMEFYSDSRFVKNKPILIVPCISDLNYDNSPKIPNSFCYLGGMAEWQNFPTIIKMMNEINENYPQSTFKIATKELDICKKIIDDFGSEKIKAKIKLYSLSSKKEIENFLSTCEYGFLIRDDIIVNQVSSPIKMAEYLSCGVNLITTSAVRSYSPLLKEAGIILDSFNDIGKISFNADSLAALKLYEELFSQHSAEIKVKLFLEELRVQKYV